MLPIRVIEGAGSSVRRPKADQHRAGIVDMAGRSAARISSAGFALSSLRQKAISSHKAAITVNTSNRSDRS